MKTDTDFTPVWVQSGDQLAPVHVIDSLQQFAMRLFALSEIDKPGELLFDYWQQLRAYANSLDNQLESRTPLDPEVAAAAHSDVTIVDPVLREITATLWTVSPDRLLMLRNFLVAFEGKATEVSV